MARSKRGLPYDPAVFDVPKDDLFGEGLITIVVGGKTMVEFDVHKKALAQVSESFANTFGENNPEIKMGLIFLHEEAPTTFQHFLKWAYNKYGGRNLRAPINQLEEHFRNMTRTDLLRLYILADKFHASLLQNEIVALFHDRLARGYKGIANLGVDEAFLKHLGWHLASNTQLFKLLARALAFRMATNPYHSLPFRRDPLNRPQHAGVHHPYPSEMSKSVMRCAAMLIPERLLRAMNENFFDLNAVPLLNEFGREVGALEKFLVAETGGNSNNN